MLAAPRPAPVAALGLGLGLRLGLGLGLAACGNSTSGPASDAAVDAPTGFTLTSAAFVDGGAIPAAHTCSGADSSPALAWTGAPADTKSFAVILTDVTLRPPLVHWVIYDIPATATGLPANVAKDYAPTTVAGAHQTLAYDDATRGYRGPCPPAAHRYQFAVYPLLTIPLPGGQQATSRNDAQSLITAHQLVAPATITGTFGP